MIGDSITIRILDVSGDSIKVGIEAPRSVPVHREEIYRRIQEANIRAASSEMPPGDFLRRLK